MIKRYFDFISESTITIPYTNDGNGIKQGILPSDEDLELLYLTLEDDGYDVCILHNRLLTDDGQLIHEDDANFILNNVVYACKEIYISKFYSENKPWQKRGNDLLKHIKYPEIESIVSKLEYDGYKVRSSYVFDDHRIIIYPKIDKIHEAKIYWSNGTMIHHHSNDNIIIGKLPDLEYIQDIFQIIPDKYSYEYIDEHSIVREECYKNGQIVTHFSGKLPDLEKTYEAVVIILIYDGDLSSNGLLPKTSPDVKKDLEVINNKLKSDGYDTFINADYSDIMFFIYPKSIIKESSEWVDRMAVKEDIGYIYFGELPDTNPNDLLDEYLEPIVEDLDLSYEFSMENLTSDGFSMGSKSGTKTNKFYKCLRITIGRFNEEMPMMTSIEDITELDRYISSICAKLKLDGYKTVTRNVDTAIGICRY